MNLHPHRRIPIDEWLKKIDAKIQTGERFFKERDNNLFDAMPAVWRNLSVESRHAVVSTIDDFIGNTPEGKTAWSAENSRKLMKYCSLDDIPKMRASYMMAKIDPGVVVGIDTKTQDEAAAERRAVMFEPFQMATLLPKQLVDHYKEKKGNEQAQMKLFNHATNYVARRHWKNNSTHLLPSSYLDLSITNEQINLLASTSKDVVQGSIIENAMGDGAKKKIAKRRINMFEGNIASYSRVVNSTEQLQAMEELNALTSVLDEIRADIDEDKVRQAAARSAEADERDKRKRLAAENAKAQKEALLPTMIMDVEAAIANDASLNNLSTSRIRDLLKFFFEPPTPGVSKMKKDELVAAVREKIVAYQQTRRVEA